jgi:nucleoside-diphosphate-sugar epimerase
MILITGASGFIGRHLARRLTAQGRELTLCSQSRDIAADLSRHPCVRLDLADQLQLHKLPTNGIETIIHLASRIPAHVSQDTVDDARIVLDSNIVSTLNMLTYARQVGARKFLFASSVSVYDHLRENPPCETDPTYPATFYGWSKLSSEILVEKYRRDAGMQCFSFRMSSVYGPGQEDHLLISRFMRQVTSGKDIHVWGKGTKRVDFIYVDDVVRVFEMVLESDKPGVYNIGSGNPVSVAELASCVNNVFGNGSSKVSFDPDKHGDDESRIMLDISRAREVLGFSPAYSLEQGLREYKKYVTQGGD